jgi:hypothetical protein
MVEPQMNAQEPFVKGSLNREVRKNDMLKIMAENEHMLRRIQQRPAHYDVALLEADHRRNEQIMHNISEFGYKSSTAPLPLRGRRLPSVHHLPAPPSSKKERPVDTSDRTCVFSQTNVEIRGAGEGVLSTLSVYERLNPFRLEFVALDQEVST